jgi:hypothetical protein
MAIEYKDDLKWKELEREVKRRTPRASLAAARVIIEIAEPLTPRKTGALRASARAKQKGDEAEVSWSAPYAAPVHEDLTAHHATGGAKFAERAINFSQRAAINAMKNEL